MARFLTAAVMPGKFLPKLAALSGRSFAPECCTNRCEGRGFHRRQGLHRRKAPWWEDGVMIKGPAIIGRNCQIRHNAYIRENVPHAA